jgi:nicotinate-nucleotide adenylyltransferase
MKPPRLGIIGGTFDPIHNGHLNAAAAALKALRLTDVLFVPSGVPAHRKTEPKASADHRFAMTTLATANNERFKVSDLEIRATAPSYTARTLQQLAHNGYDPSQLFFITGSDAFVDIEHWYDYPELLNRSNFIVISRPGLPASTLPNQLPSLESRINLVTDTSQLITDTAPSTAIWLVDADTSNASSSDIRKGLEAGTSVSNMLPPLVETYIVKQLLYRNPSLKETHT